VSRTGGTGVQYCRFRDQEVNSDSKSAWFYGAGVELPFNAGAGRKQHCRMRGEYAILPLAPRSG
jgi:hypothetical protein